MKIEDRLSDAMHDYADAIEPSEGSWSRISGRFDDGGPSRRPARGRLVLAGVAIALVLVLIAVLAVRDDGATNKVATDTGPPPSLPSTTSRPPGVLASTIGGVVESMDSGTGEVHEKVATLPARSSVRAVPPDGLKAVYGTASSNGPCVDPRAEVGSVDLATDKRTRIVSGAVAPVVSPDGRFVAYGIQCDGVTLGFSDLRNGTNYRAVLFPSNVKPRPMESLEPVAWAPDSERLLYRIRYAGEDLPRYMLGRIWPQTDEPDAAALTGRAFTAAAFIDDQTIAVAEDAGAGSWVTLVSLAVPACAAGVCTIPLASPTPPAFDVPGRVTSLVAAPGSHLLAITEGNVLYRWSMGASAPTKLADGVVSASWIPWS